MPVKFKPSATVVVDRATRKVRTVNYYMKDTSTKELQAVVESSNAKPKQKQKCRNELVARGVV
tara:strand:+ start:251 stop:439 length:189 start_codon:yes stop_codon:yes gene_type:complete